MGSFTYQDREPSFGGIVPEGKICFRVLNDQYTCDKVAPSSGNEYINLRMEMVGQYNEVTGQWERKQGGKVFDKLVFSEKTMYQLDNFLSSAGKAPAVGTEISLSARDVIDWIVYAVVVHETDESKPETDKFRTEADIVSYITTKSEFHPSHTAVGAAPAPTVQAEKPAWEV
jgi:hypothetical protein